MKKLLVLISMALLASNSALARDDRESTVGFSSQSNGTALIFDVANEKNENVLGVRAALPLNQTTRAVEAMNERWKSTPKSKVELYGTIDLGYHHISN
jgi:hypothetical protein